jgi:hypothetical protein
VEKPSGIRTTWPLPVATDSGVALRAQRELTPSDAAVGLSLGSAHQQKVRVTLSQREVELSSTLVDLAGGRPQSVWLAARDAEGVLTATVWSPQGQPLAERLIYRQPGKALAIELRADKARYVPGDQVKLTARTTRDGKPVSAVIGLSVTDDAVLEMIEKREQAPSLPVMMLLEPEVRELADAHVYLDARNPKAPLALDLLLGTQGWRRFALENVSRAVERYGDQARRALAIRVQQPPVRLVAKAKKARGVEHADAIDDLLEGSLGAGMAGPAAAAPKPMAAIAAAPPAPPARPAPRAEPVMVAPKDEAPAEDRRRADAPAEKEIAANKVAFGGRAHQQSAFVFVREYAPPGPPRAPPHRSARLHRDPVLARRPAHRRPRRGHRALRPQRQRHRVQGQRRRLRRRRRAGGGGDPDRVGAALLRRAQAAAGGDRRGHHPLAHQPGERHHPDPARRADRGQRSARPAPGLAGAAGSGPGGARAPPAGHHGRPHRQPGRADPGGQRRRLRDNVSRTVAVKPNGFPFELAFGGLTVENGAATQSITIPAGVVPGSLRTTVAVYPTPLANLTKALARLIQDPSGCFEQTSSTSYPLTMAQQYFTSHTGVDPQMIATARQKLDAGYQRLVGFETKERGYEWFGENPGHEALTAYGLLHFHDMARIRPVDQAMLTRTRDWLLAQRDGQGGFSRKRRALHTWIEDKDASNGYILWALLETGARGLEREVAAFKTAAAASQNSYVVALGANVAALSGDRATARKLAERLAARQNKGGAVDGGTASIVGSEGEALAIETPRWRRWPGCAMRPSPPRSSAR